MKTFVIGDIHGGYKSLLQCLQRSHFNYSKDHLIVLGDVCDGWPEVGLCIEELLSIVHCTLVLGNHDLWALRWAETGWEEPVWTQQGGQNTIRSYQDQPMPRSHIYFLRNGLPFYKEEGRLFVHGGFDHHVPIENQRLEVLSWDRDLITLAAELELTTPEYKFGGYDEIYVGHTPTLRFDSMEPVKFCNVWDLDTGGGWYGKLTIMNVESHAYWQSDLVTELYKGERGRF